MSSLLKLVFIIVATNAGGEGKTMLAQAARQGKVIQRLILRS
ncbi:hypothetical protein [Blastomonas sp.]